LVSSNVERITTKRAGIETPKAELNCWPKRRGRKVPRTGGGELAKDTQRVNERVERGLLKALRRLDELKRDFRAVEKRILAGLIELQRERWSKGRRKTAGGMPPGRCEALDVDGIGSGVLEVLRFLEKRMSPFEGYLIVKVLQDMFEKRWGFRLVYKRGHVLVQTPTAVDAIHGEPDKMYG
jgi:hypothetical protein